VGRADRLLYLLPLTLTSIGKLWGGRTASSISCHTLVDGGVTALKNRIRGCVGDEF
jgi:hypothetical protein